jgi:hypothetical protein
MRNTPVYLKQFVNFIFIATILLISSTLGICGEISGSIHCRNQEEIVPLESAVAVWDAEIKTLYLMLFNRLVLPEEMDYYRSHTTGWHTVIVPFVTVSFKLKKDEGVVDRKHVFSVSWSTDCPESFTFSDMPGFRKEEFKQQYPKFQADLDEGGLFEISSKGSKSFGGKFLKWEFNVSTKILTKLNEFIPLPTKYHQEGGK